MNIRRHVVWSYRNSGNTLSTGIPQNSLSAQYVHRFIACCSGAPGAIDWTPAREQSTYVARLPRSVHAKSEDLEICMLRAIV